MYMGDLYVRVSRGVTMGVLYRAGWGMGRGGVYRAERRVDIVLGVGRRGVDWAGRGVGMVGVYRAGRGYGWCVQSKAGCGYGWGVQGAAWVWVVRTGQGGA